MEYLSIDQVTAVIAVINNKLPPPVFASIGLESTYQYAYQERSFYTKHLPEPRPL